MKDEKVEGSFIGYKQGFKFSVRAEELDKRKVKVHYSDWEGVLAGSSHFKVYEWKGDLWTLVEIDPMSVY